MDMKIFDYIIAIAEHESVTKAAESVFISQSGLNQQLLKLEDELGVPLFYRNKKSLRLTPAGEIYVRNARVMRRLIKNTEQQIRDLSHSPSGRMNLGLPSEHGVSLLIEISEAFHKKYPNVTISMMESTVATMEKSLKSNNLDMAFIMRADNPDSRFASVKLCEERLILGIPSTHPLALEAAPYGKKPGTISLNRFRNETFAFMFEGSTMRQVIDPLFKGAGFSPNILFESGMNTALRRLVEKGLCCTIIPQSMARHDDHIAWFFLDDDPRWNWYIIYVQPKFLTMADKYLIELALEYSERMKDHWDLFGIGSPFI